MGPLGKLSASNVGPVAIVIDALDERGGVETRRDFLRILSAGKLRNPPVAPITALPHNCRFIVTSRPLRDIDAELNGAPHISRISIEDIPPEVAERDIRVYVAEELIGLSDFGDTEFGAFAKKTDLWFENLTALIKAL